MKMFSSINRDEYEDLLSATSHRDLLSVDGAMSHGSLSEIENRTIVNAIGQGGYAMAAQIIPHPDSKIAALSALATELSKSNGIAAKQSIDAFIKAGYTNEGLAEVMVKVAIYNTSSMLFNDLEFDGALPLAAA